MNPHELVNALRDSACRIEQSMKMEPPVVGNLAEAYQALSVVGNDVYWTLELKLSRYRSDKIEVRWRAYSEHAKWSDDLKTLQAAVRHILDGEKEPEPPQEPAAVIAAVQDTIETPVPF